MDLIASYLNAWWDNLWLGFWGFVGATINLLLYKLGGKPLSKPLILATVISGVAMAVLGSGFIGLLMGIDPTKAGGLGLCALFAGMLGIKVATKVVNMEIKLPVGERPL